MYAADIAEAVSSLLFFRQPPQTIPTVFDPSSIVCETVGTILRYHPERPGARHRLNSSSDDEGFSMFRQFVKLRACADFCIRNHQQPQIHRTNGPKNCKTFYFPQSATILPIGGISVVRAGTAQKQMADCFSEPKCTSVNIPFETMPDWDCQSRILSFVISNLGIPCPSAFDSDLIPIVVCIDDGSNYSTALSSIATQFCFGDERSQLWSFFKHDLFLVPPAQLKSGAQIHMVLLLDLNAIKAGDAMVEDANFKKVTSNCVRFANFVVLDWMSECEAQEQLQPLKAQHHDGSRSCAAGGAARQSSSATIGVQYPCIPESKLVGQVEGSVGNRTSLRHRSKTGN